MPKYGYWSVPNPFEEMKTDLRSFLNTLPVESGDWQAIKQSVRTVLGMDYAVDPDEARQLLVEVFEL